MQKILLVEDEAMLRETFQLIMASQPYVAHSSANGLAALDLCRITAYDLILLDLMMPTLDGVGFLRQFGAFRQAGTKVIILSNLSSGRELDEAATLGVKHSILKATLSPRQLLTMVQHELQTA